MLMFAWGLVSGVILSAAFVAGLLIHDIKEIADNGHKEFKR